MRREALTPCVFAMGSGEVRHQLKSMNQMFTDIISAIH